jgi:hypothetical protein
MAGRIDTLEREAIARRVAVRTAALDLRDRLTPAGLRAEALLQAERAGFSFAATARARWIEVGAIAVALIAVGVAMAQGRLRQPPAPRRSRTALRNSTFTSNPRKEINNGDIHQNAAAAGRDPEAGSPRAQASGPDEIG